MIKKQLPTPNAALLAFALNALASTAPADSGFTPVTVKVHDKAGEDTYPGEALYYALSGLGYDPDRDEWVLEIDQSGPVPGKCTYTLSHTRDWCGNPRCREH